MGRLVEVERLDIAEAVPPAESGPDVSDLDAPFGAEAVASGSRLHVDDETVERQYAYVAGRLFHGLSAPENVTGQIESSPDPQKSMPWNETTQNLYNRRGPAHPVHRLPVVGA